MKADRASLLRAHHPRSRELLFLELTCLPTSLSAAMIYARAPPAFQARYFPPTQPRASSPLGTLNPNLSSSTAYLSSSTLQIPSNGYSNGNVPSSWSTSSKRGLSHTASQVSLSSNFSSASTVRPPLRLRVGVTPQMFKAELEWLYTGEGMGEVVEWLNDREGRGPGGGQGLGLGLDGDSPGEWGKIEGPGGMGGKTERLRNVSLFAGTLRL